MTVQKIILKRSFVLTNNGTNTTLPDPNPDLTPDQVRKFYATRHPELVSSTVTGPKYEGDTMVYSFKSGVGTKG